jgi:hypothetical protein
MIVAAKLQQPQVLDLARQAMQDEDPGLRYWASRVIRQQVQQAEKMPENQRKALLQTLMSVINGDAEPRVVQSSMLALAAMPGGNADQRLLEALNGRIAVHAKNPEQSYMPEQAALQNLVGQVARRQANGNASQQQIVALARVAYRYMALIERQAANNEQNANDANGGNSNSEANARSGMAEQVQNVLKRTAGWLDVSNPPRSLKAWQQRLTQAPYNLNQQQLALPSPGA